jgi:hypothetical protein
MDMITARGNLLMRHIAVLQATRFEPVINHVAAGALGLGSTADTARPRRRGDRKAAHSRTLFAASAHKRLWPGAAVRGSAAIRPGRSVGLHVRNECGVDREGGADARVARAFTDDLDVNPIHELVRDVGVKKTVEGNASDTCGLYEPIEALGDAGRVEGRSIGMTEY